MKSQSLFDKFAKWASRATGRPTTFWLAIGLIVAWLFSKPLFSTSDTWQLVINTTTTIVTFLMVFLIQTTQNRDTAAMHVKLDELIRAMKGAHNALLDLEELNEHDLTKIRDNYEKLAAQARAALQRGDSDAECPEVDSEGECADDELKNKPGREGVVP